jgi:hypothetical protein
VGGVLGGCRHPRASTGTQGTCVLGTPYAWLCSCSVSPASTCEVDNHSVRAESPSAKHHLRLQSSLSLLALLVVQRAHFFRFGYCSACLRCCTFQLGCWLARRPRVQVGVVTARSPQHEHPDQPDLPRFDPLPPSFSVAHP